MEQITSANKVNKREIVLPTPRGSGNDSARLSNATHLARPWLKNVNPNIFLVGFKAEFNISRDEIIYCARKQIEDAGTDLVVANDVSHDECNFGSDKNEVLIIDSDVLSVPLATKDEIAKTIMNVISDNVYNSVMKEECVDIKNWQFFHNIHL